MEWSLIFFLYMKALSDGMVIDFLMFTARPSPVEWSLFSFFIKALYNGMVIDFCHIKALSDGMVIDFLSLRQGPLRCNGH